MHGGEGPDGGGGEDEVDDGHHVVRPAPADGVGEDAAEHQTQRVPERTPHPIHRKGDIPPRSLGESIGYQTDGRGQTHRDRDPQQRPHNNNLQPRPRQPDAQGKRKEQVTARHPHELGANDIRDGAKDEEETPRGEGVHGGGPEDQALGQANVLGDAGQRGDEDAGAHGVEEADAGERDDDGDAADLGDGEG